MAETKTKTTKISVRDFIAGVENDTRRKDAETLLKAFRESDRVEGADVGANDRRVRPLQIYV